MFACCIHRHVYLICFMQAVFDIYDPLEGVQKQMHVPSEPAQGACLYVCTSFFGNLSFRASSMYDPMPDPVPPAML